MGLVFRSFWFDNWVYAFPLAELFEDAHHDASFKVSDFISHDNQWMSSKLEKFVSTKFVKDIVSMFIRFSSMTDNMVWGLTTHGEYLVQSGDKLLQGYDIQYTPKVEFEWIWKSNVPHKIRFFIWKICLDGPLSKDHLERSHIFLPQEYVLCNFHKENDFHLLCDCSFAHNVLLSFTNLMARYS